jgi:hypothetical protein
VSFGYKDEVEVEDIFNGSNPFSKVALLSFIGTELWLPKKLELLYLLCDEDEDTGAAWADEDRIRLLFMELLLLLLFKWLAEEEGGCFVYWRPRDECILELAGVPILNQTVLKVYIYIYTMFHI